MATRDPITCHVLDTVKGRPAKGIPCQLFKLDDRTLEFKSVSTAVTDSDGRIAKWGTPLAEITASTGRVVGGCYKIRFDTLAYLTASTAHSGSTKNAFFPFVEIVFLVDNPADGHYHIPLLLSNYSYSTYRGS
ncbi:hypothetical protein AWJ20_3538 [Sugiyamaella lignohabitans]|uniref:5-hydroxyisourate hydrolase n=1 Tax=Sugiyamaella lignohabitans TaxID=796027 RepID=A0A167FZ94_9ASCO|nr:uncharacterized protein AWJ20_3538 [Sugiyamaella lignohabitans]ANB15894.1 hypothetical protein AWJ20_3538 [Sugiyamaella lignohabitans]